MATSSDAYELPPGPAAVPGQLFSPASGLQSPLR